MLFIMRDTLELKQEELNTFSKIKTQTKNNMKLAYTMS